MRCGILKNLFAYFKPGYQFSRDRSGSEKTKGTVILIHGWGVRGESMQRLADMLSATEYSVLNYDYPSSRKNISEHAEIFLELLRKESISGKIFFLTHSMGGILLRAAMAKMSEEECRMISAIVMLGPPNKGSRLAIPGKNRMVRFFNASLGDMVPSKNSYLFQIPLPAYLPPVGIIAGKYDGKVKFSDTELPEGMEFHRITAFCNHPALRNPKNTGKAILSFFRCFHF